MPKPTRMPKPATTPTAPVQQPSSPKDLYGSTRYRVKVERLSSNANSYGSYTYALKEHPDDLPVDSDGKILGTYGNDGRKVFYFQGMKGTKGKEFVCDISIISYTNKKTGVMGHSIVINKSDTEVKEEEETTTKAQRGFKAARAFGVERKVAGKMMFAKFTEDLFGSAMSEPVAEDSNESED